MRKLRNTFTQPTLLYDATPRQFEAKKYIYFAEKSLAYKRLINNFDKRKMVETWFSTLLHSQKSLA